MYSPNFCHLVFDFCHRVLEFLSSGRRTYAHSLIWLKILFFPLEYRLSIEEFIPLVKEVEKDRQQTPEQLTTCLENFDRDGNGLVNVVELRYVLSSIGQFVFLSFKSPQIL